MIVNGKAVISEDIKESYFACDLDKCKGACCVEGDLGAPLQKDELEILDRIYADVAPYISPEGKKAINAQGKYLLDEEGDYSTPTINKRECAYAVYDDRGILKCGIERAYQDGKIDFIKPVSCHLYPIRITKYEEYDALNYDRWQICSPACQRGTDLEIPLYRFVKDALVRKYGKSWYEELVGLIEASVEEESKER